MSVVESLQKSAIESLTALFGQAFTEKDFQVNQTKPEFEGDYTVVLFSLVKSLKLSPDAIGTQLGNHLIANNPALFTKYNIIKGFLNLSIADGYWMEILGKNYNNTSFGQHAVNGKKVMVEYSSPNTNKPLHLGHLRNNFLGWSVAEIFKATGYEVIKSCIVNDRGIHICKSMIAWQLFADGATPQSTNTKGDHFVGDYYVKFNDEFKKQSKPILDLIFIKDDLSLFNEEEKTKLIALKNNIVALNAALEKEIEKADTKEFAKIGNRIIELFDAAKSNNGKWKDIIKSLDDKKFFDLDPKQKEEKQKVIQKVLKPILAIEEKLDTANEEIKDLAGNKTPVMKATQQMLLDWEAGKPDVMELWATMNSWVYAGFDTTYKTIGSDFDTTYYESNTYLLGKKIVAEGLQKHVFNKEDDNSVWIDLTTDGLDKKIVQRKDGTSVYITQDIGLAQQKYEEYNIDRSIYVIGDEQNYHMKVLKLIAEKLQLPNAENIYHLSYGMVELPTGKMKSREGTVVDADDIVAEMEKVAQEKTEELGKVKDFTAEELIALYHTIGLGALKFFLLRVDPKKKMIFNPEESIDFHGFTGPFIQFNHARIKSILRKEDKTLHALTLGGFGTLQEFLPLEKELIVALEQYPTIVKQACDEMNPSAIAIYVYHIAKTFSSFYTEHSIANAETEDKKQLRLQLASMTANVIKSGMHLLGVAVPERM